MRTIKSLSNRLENTKWVEIHENHPRKANGLSTFVDSPLIFLIKERPCGRIINILVIAYLLRTSYK